MKAIYPPSRASSRGRRTGRTCSPSAMRCYGAPVGPWGSLVTEEGRTCRDPWPKGKPAVSARNWLEYRVCGRFGGTDGPRSPWPLVRNGLNTGIAGSTGHGWARLDAGQRPCRRSWPTRLLSCSAVECYAPRRPLGVARYSTSWWSTPTRSLASVPPIWPAPMIPIFILHPSARWRYPRICTPGETTVPATRPVAGAGLDSVALE